MVVRDGSKYLGNLNKESMEVHNLENEKGNCQIDEIIRYKHFAPDNLATAHFEGYDNCHWCIGGSTR